MASEVFSAIDPNRISDKSSPEMLAMRKRLLDMGIGDGPLSLQQQESLREVEVPSRMAQPRAVVPRESSDNPVIEVLNNRFNQGELGESEKEFLIRQKLERFNKK